MTTAAWITVGVAAAGALGAFARRALDLRRGRRSTVEVVRVDLNAGEKDDRCAVLDITLRNTGPAPAVVHELVLDDIEVWAFPRTVSPSALPIAATYQADLGASTHTVVRLSQEIRPGEADRFAVQLGTSKPIFPFVGGFLYLFTASLTIDRGRRSTPLGRFLARIPQPMLVRGYHGVGGPDPRVDELVAKAVELESIIQTGVHVQPSAQAVLNELIRRDPDTAP